ncbi:hypothetical protein MHC_04605 [Mycoplasma haemocanis str. Illinois]|uniref:Uncharacterized protein n=1 Tax=Mycoplasma haemocanis (strain Illinois) TaxID=1111676 RepID=H6N805_MYCHN|nr:hypothetical protein [Mycoplasma haemocanis]AEW45777.1 hypothetical protein MHC_04605 [Mycoplasma haemocanis str. Illinois]
MTLPVKVAIGFVGAGTVAAGAYVAFPPSKPSTSLSVRDHLKKSGYSLLNLNLEDSSTHASEWEKVKGAYVAENDGQLKFNGVNTSNTINGIKGACSFLLRKESYSSADLEKARRWCVVPVTVASRIGSHLALLDTKASDGDSALWKDKLSEYKKNDSSSPKMPVTKANTGGDVTETDLKKECEKISSLHTFDKDFETLVMNTQLWCTKSKVN